MMDESENENVDPDEPRIIASYPIHISAADRVMVVSPHPDDESLATGGLLLAARAAGAAVRVIFLTNGENNPWAQLRVEGRWPFRAADRARWARRRRAETIAALARLGVDDHRAAFLNFPDQGLTDLLLRGDDRASRAIADEFVRWRPTLIAMPSPDDAHPDHGSASVMIAFALAGLAVLDRPQRVYRYLVHKGAAAQCAPWQVLLDPGQRQRKREAILCHQSQLRWRRHQLLSFARWRESYGTASESGARMPGHPVRSAYFAAGALPLECDVPHRFGIGPTVLRVATFGRTGAPVRLSLVLPTRSCHVSVRDTVTGRVLGSASCVRDVGIVHIRLTLSAAAPVGLCFVKLERPAERRLGFFDSAGWRHAPVMWSPVRSGGLRPAVERAPAELEMAM